MKRKESFYATLSKAYEKPLLQSLKEFVAIDSVYDEKTVSKTNPFGKGVSKALQYVEALAKKDGFKVTNYDNKVIEIIEGEGPKNITILAHADVVPVGSGWDQNPFEVKEKKGVLFGRGVADDKGPLLSSYYALKMLKDHRLLSDHYHVRLLVGGNEERGSLCMEHYFGTLKKYQPDLGFSPDADFPLIYAEKGIINFSVKKALDLKDIVSIKGGVASNSVIEKCEVVMKNHPHFVDYLKENNIKCDVSKDNDLLKVTFLGKAAHGSMPQEGINAGMIAINSLAFYFDNKELNQLSRLYNDLYGKGINAYNESPDLGKNSMNVGIIDYEDKHFNMIVNFRYVDGVDKNKTIKNIKDINKPFNIEVLGEAPLLFYPKDSTLVSTLLRVYQEETGDKETKPLAIGGGTYAKEVDNCIAFGLTFPGENPKMHAVGENVKISDLVSGIAIYAHAVIELGKKL